MKKDHVDSQSPTASQPLDMLKTFSSLMSGAGQTAGNAQNPTAGQTTGGSNRQTTSRAPGASLPKQDSKLSGVPEGYNNRKFEKLIREHDRISREIDRKYNGGKPPKAGD